MKPIDKDRMVFSWLAGAWDDYLNALPLLLPVILIQTALAAVSFYIVWRYHSLLAAAPYMLFIMTPLATGANLVYIKLARGGGARLRDLFSAFPIYPRALAVSVGLGLLTMGGAVMFILPGIVLYLAYAFSEYAVVDRRTGIRESFRLSASITYGWKTRLFTIFSLVMLVHIAVPDIFVISGPLTDPAASLDLKPWTVVAAVLKTLVFLPWLAMAMARAYNTLSAGLRAEQA